MDEGGVQKEFFQLITPMLFNKDFGMFVFNEEARTYWFSNNKFVSGENFELLGKVLPQTRSPLPIVIAVAADAVMF